MCKDSSLHCFLVDYRHILLGQEVESVKVCRVCLNVKILLWLFDIHNCFKQNSRAFLDKLTHRMKIGGEDCRGRIDSFVILTFTFTKQLFIPFIHHGKCRFIGHHDFNCFSFAVKDVSQCRISVTIVLFQITDSKCFSCFCCTVHQLLDIRTGNCDWKQSYCGQYGISSADIIRNNKGFITFFVCQLF